MTGLLVVDTALFVLAVLGPGVLAAHAVLGPDSDAIGRWAGGATLGLFLVPLLTYTLAVAVGTHVSAGLIIGVGALVVLPSGVVLWRRRSARPDIAGS